MHLNNLIVGKEFSVHHGFNVCTGAHYLGGFIANDKSKRDWLKHRTPMWEKNNVVITETAGKHNQ